MYYYSYKVHIDNTLELDDTICAWGGCDGVREFEQESQMQVIHPHIVIWDIKNTAVVSLASSLARGRGQSNMCNLEDQ